MFLSFACRSDVVRNCCKLLILLGLAATEIYAQGTYTTSFANPENPISEGGRWVNGGTTGLKWSNVQTTSGFAYGTESGSVNYNDSTAVLTGAWGPNQSAQAVVKVNQADRGVFEEVELRLRTSISANNITGYEINCSVVPSNPYLQIVRWNGAFGSWTELDGRSVGCKNGDVLKATVVGSTITAYKNGSAVFSVTDRTYPNGAPGIGFYLQGGTSTLNSHFGFSNFTATDGTTTDSTPPSTPTGLTGTAVSSTEVNLSWNASTDNVGVSGYRIYRNGTQIGSSASTSYADSGLTSSTSYTYTVTAMDSSGNLSQQSAPVTITTSSSQDTTPPSIPGNLAASSVNSSGATLSWTASTDNVGVAGYQVFRNGNKVSTVTSTTFTDSGLTPSTSYSYTVAAFDSSNNLSAQSQPLTVTTSPTSTSTTPSFVQMNQSGIVTGTNVSSSFNTATTKGNAVIAYVVWNNSSVVTLSDTQGNAFHAATSPLIWAGNYSAQVFYATNISGGSDSISARFAGSSTAVVYIDEYAGINPTNPIDVTASAGGTGSNLNSGAATTTAANDLIFGAGVSNNVVNSAGANFTARDLGYGHITEDRIATTPGSYTATATHNGNTWGMQMVAFRSASSGSGTSTTWGISGTITGGAGSTVSLTGTQSASTTADSGGNYTFGNLANGTYTITPSKSGYSFSPASTNVTVNGGNVTGTNFTATASQTWSISGTISGGSGATVALSGAKSASTTADANGNFSFGGLSNGSYKLTPSKTGYTFSPASAAANVNGANVTGVNFTASSTSGPHSVDLNWTASTSSGVSGYKVYRSNSSGGPYTLLNTAPVTSTVYTDLTVSAGATYYYVITSVDSAGDESAYSNQAKTTLPTP